MSAENEKLSPELRLKLLEAEKNAIPDYPDWKRGFKYGITALIIGVLVSPFMMLILPHKPAAAWGYTLFAIFSIALLAFATGAFRPAVNKKSTHDGQ